MERFLGVTSKSFVKLLILVTERFCFSDRLSLKLLSSHCDPGGWEASKKNNKDECTGMGNTIYWTTA